MANPSSPSSSTSSSQSSTTSQSTSTTTSALQKLYPYPTALNALAEEFFEGCADRCYFDKDYKDDDSSKSNHAANDDDDDDSCSSSDEDDDSSPTSSTSSTSSSSSSTTATYNPLLDKNGLTFLDDLIFYRIIKGPFHNSIYQSRLTSKRRDLKIKEEKEKNEREEEEKVRREAEESMPPSARKNNRRNIVAAGRLTMANTTSASTSKEVQVVAHAHAQAQAPLPAFTSSLPSLLSSSSSTASSSSSSPLPHLSHLTPFLNLHGLTDIESLNSFVPTGTCQFSSLSAALTNSLSPMLGREMWRPDLMLRQLALHTIANNISLYKDYLTPPNGKTRSSQRVGGGSVDVGGYLKGMSNERTDGDAVMLQGLVDCLRVCVRVVRLGVNSSTNANANTNGSASVNVNSSGLNGSYSSNGDVISVSTAESMNYGKWDVDDWKGVSPVAKIRKTSFTSSSSSSSTNHQQQHQQQQQQQPIHPSSLSTFNPSNYHLSLSPELLPRPLLTPPSAELKALRAKIGGRLIWMAQFGEAHFRFIRPISFDHHDGDGSNDDDGNSSGGNGSVLREGEGKKARRVRRNRLRRVRGVCENEEAEVVEVSNNGVGGGNGGVHVVRHVNTASTAIEIDDSDDDDNDDDAIKVEVNNDEEEGTIASTSSLTSSSLTNTLTQDVDICGICLEPLTPTTASSPASCQHEFCYDCLIKWSAISFNSNRNGNNGSDGGCLCPLCKVRYEEVRGPGGVSEVVGKKKRKKGKRNHHNSDDNDGSDDDDDDDDDMDVQVAPPPPPPPPPRHFNVNGSVNNIPFDSRVLASANSALAPAHSWMNDNDNDNNDENGSCSGIEDGIGNGGRVGLSEEEMAWRDMAVLTSNENSTSAGGGKKKGKREGKKKEKEDDDDEDGSFDFIGGRRAPAANNNAYVNVNVNVSVAPANKRPKVHLCPPSSSSSTTANANHTSSHNQSRSQHQLILPTPPSSSSPSDIAFIKKLLNAAVLDQGVMYRRIELLSSLSSSSSSLEEESMARAEEGGRVMTMISGLRERLGLSSSSSSSSSAAVSKKAITSQNNLITLGLLQLLRFILTPLELPSPSNSKPTQNSHSLQNRLPNSTLRKQIYVILTSLSLTNLTRDNLSCRSDGLPRLLIWFLFIEGRGNGNGSGSGDGVDIDVVGEEGEEVLRGLVCKWGRLSSGGGSSSSSSSSSSSNVVKGKSNKKQLDNSTQHPQSQAPPPPPPPPPVQRGKGKREIKSVSVLNISRDNNVGLSYV